MNSNKIYQAYKENDSRFKEIEELSNKISTTFTEKLALVPEIIKIYQLVFKNFVTQKIETSLNTNHNSYGGHLSVVYINLNGFALKQDYMKILRSITEESNKDFIKLLKIIKSNKDVIEKLLSKQTKKDILNKFLEKIDLVNVEFAYKKLLPDRIDITTYCEYIYDTRDIDETFKDFQFCFENYGSHSLKLKSSNRLMDLNSLNLQDKIIIEQIYEELKLALQEILIEEEQKLTDTKTYIEDLKDKFSSQLIINELKEKK